MATPSVRYRPSAELLLPEISSAVFPRSKVELHRVKIYLTEVPKVLFSACMSLLGILLISSNSSAAYGIFKRPPAVMLSVETPERSSPFKV